MARTLVEIDAEIAVLEKARLEFLTGKRRIEVGYGGDTVRYSDGGADALAEIDSRLAALYAERAGVAGDSRQRPRPLYLGF